MTHKSVWDKIDTHARAIRFNTVLEIQLSFPTFCRLEFLGTEAVCVPSPCSEGETLWVDGDCYPLAEEGAGTNCSSQLRLSEESQLIVCTTAIRAFSFLSYQRKDCPGKYVWSKNRNKCVARVAVLKKSQRA